MNLSDLFGGALGLGGALFNSNQQGQTANQYLGMGQPYRDRLTAITNDPNLYYNSADAQALANQSDRRYSASVGNPAGSGTAQAGALEAMLRGYGNERDRLFNYGGGAYFNQAAPQQQQNALGANMGIFKALGPLLAILGQGGGLTSSGGSGANTGFDMSGSGSGDYFGFNG
jgi:hypothetical protein